MNSLLRDQELPSHWRSAQLGHVALVSTGSADVQDAVDNGKYPFFVRSEEVRTLNRFTHNTEAVLTAGDGNVGDIFHYYQGKFAAHQRVYVIEPGEGLLGKYLYYAMQNGFKDSLQGTTAKSTVESLRRPMLTRFRIPFPPLKDQLVIAEFLDHETSEIDAFIADQERLIELLEERRAATITHAVTKGLDPNAPMKDSGTEWVGNIPASWDMKRISWLFGTISSGTTPPVQISEYFDGEFNWVTTSELRETSITHTNRTITRKALREFPSLRLYGPGTLLIAMYGATIGRLGLLETPAATNQACCAFSEPVGTSSKFVFYVLLAAREHLMMLADGGGQPNINQDKLRSLRIPQPDLKTQNEIVDFLDQETSALDAAVSDAREAIALSQERRAALISAAVTGQMDVSQAQRPVDEVLEEEVRV